MLQMELGELKRQTLQRSSNGFRSREVLHDFKVVMPDEESVESVGNGVVFHQHFVRLKHALHFFYVWKLHVL